MAVPVQVVPKDEDRGPSETGTAADDGRTAVTTTALVRKQCLRGEFLLLPSDMVCQYMFKYGVWADPEAQLCLDILSKVPGDIVEAGAHVGTHTVPLAREAAKTGHTLMAVEPQAVLFELLLQNVALNSLNNVRLHNAFLSRAPGRVPAQVAESYLVPWNYGAYSIDRGYSQERPYPGVLRPNQETEVTTVDQLVADYGLAPSLLKLDVEGHELEVLKGAQVTLSTHLPYIFAEVMPFAAGPFVRALRDMGYTCYWAISARPDKGGADFNMVCTPDGRTKERGRWEPVGLEKASAIGPPARLPPFLERYPV